MGWIILGVAFVCVLVVIKPLIIGIAAWYELINEVYKLINGAFEDWVDTKVPWSSWGVFAPVTAVVLFILLFFLAAFLGFFDSSYPR